MGVGGRGTRAGSFDGDALVMVLPPKYAICVDVRARARLVTAGAGYDRPR